jgi:hypothetical protein
VETQVACYNGQLPPGLNGVAGTYSAYCHTSGSGWIETESASVIFGSKVEVRSLSGPLFGYAGWAEATFSANYVFTLTGGSNLFDFGAWSGGPHALGALALPCFKLVNQYPSASSSSLAYLDGPLYSYGTRSPGDLCGTGATGIPVLLNVQTDMQLMLTAYSAVDENGSGSASAEFDGFRLFVPIPDPNNSSGGFILPAGPDVTFTFALVPEPGSFALMAAAAALWLFFRRRLSV